MPATVPPRVIPLFLHELASTPLAIRVANLEHFVANVDRIFGNAKVEDEDVMDLVVTLLSFAQADANFFEREIDEATGERKASLSQLALEILSTISNPTWCHSSRTYRALGRIIKRIRSFREEAAPEAMLAADHTAAADDTLAALSPVKAAAIGDQSATNVGDPSSVGLAVISAATAHPEHVARALAMDAWVQHDDLRASVIELWQTWDVSGVDVSYFCAAAETLPLHLPQLRTSRLKVFRDFVLCTQRPKLAKQWGSVSVVHVKTNIKAQSDVMYRFLVEGYNYGVNAAINSDVVGFTNRRWDEIGNMTKYGWPEGWDAETTNDYAAGCAISQYYSSDRFLVLRLRAKSFFSVGFGVSAWLVFHGLGEGMPVTATIHHQDDDL